MPKEKRIFDLLKQIRDMKTHHGLLIVFSDINNVLAHGAFPVKSKEKVFEKVGTIFDENIDSILARVGDDGAVLIDDDGFVYSPSVYLNVSLFHVDKSEIKPDFCARHIAALSTSASTNANVFTLSEETGKVRKFVAGKLKEEYPEPADEKVLEIVQRDIEREKLEQGIVKILVEN